MNHLHIHIYIHIYLTALIFNHPPSTKHSLINYLIISLFIFFKVPYGPTHPHYHHAVFRFQIIHKKDEIFSSFIQRYRRCFPNKNTFLKTHTDPMQISPILIVMLADLPPNIVLLLLQIILARQQEYCKLDKTKKLENLLVDPILDNEILERFIKHPLLKIYHQPSQSLTLRQLKILIREVFDNGFQIIYNDKDDYDFSKISDKFTKDTIPNIISLANFYYECRIAQLENELIPNIKSDLVHNLLQSTI